MSPATNWAAAWEIVCQASSGLEPPLESSPRGSTYFPGGQAWIADEGFDRSVVVWGEVFGDRRGRVGAAARSGRHRGRWVDDVDSATSSLDALEHDAAKEGQSSERETAATASVSELFRRRSPQPIVWLGTGRSCYRFGDAMEYDLIIVGGSASGLSVAVSSQRSGLQRVRIVEKSRSVAFPELIGDEALDVGFGEAVSSVDVVNGSLIVNSDRLSYRTKSVLIADRPNSEGWDPPIPATLGERVHSNEIPEAVDEQDVLVVGKSDHAVELCAALSAAGARVVLAAGGMDPTLLSPAADSVLRRLERDRKITVLYRSVPDQIGEIAGFPMAYFSDRRTPDLQFDHVVFASTRVAASPEPFGITNEAMGSGCLWFVGEPSNDLPAPTAPSWDVGLQLAASCFPELQLAPSKPTAEVRRRHTGAIDELRAEHYNATITHFEPSHSDLWVLRVKPDTGDTSYLPGQYASLGLGYWEARIDTAVDPDLDKKWDKLIRRSYSISSRMFDETGYLFDERGSPEMEFYIVLVPPTDDNVPGLTPRLALKKPGDRIYLGPKVAGRYTLDAVKDPNCSVLFLSTGTGEAPHNAMVTELLRKGHTGPIVSAVTVRQWQDLGYRTEHEELARRYPNYSYIPLPTREADVPKRYIQDLLRPGASGQDVLASDHGVKLDPETSHVFLCGNPAMIGLPEGEGESVAFPETEGVVEILTKRGFTIDRRKQPGTIHFEEYW